MRLPLKRLVVAAIAIPAPVKARIERVEVLGVQSILHDPQGFTEPLEVHDLSHAQELDGLADIRILHQTQDIVIGSSRLLLCRHILHQIRDNVAGGLELSCRERNAACPSLELFYFCSQKLKNRADKLYYSVTEVRSPSLFISLHFHDTLQGYCTQKQNQN